MVEDASADRHRASCFVLLRHATLALKRHGAWPTKDVEDAGRTGRGPRPEGKDRTDRKRASETRVRAIGKRRRTDDVLGTRLCSVRAWLRAPAETDAVERHDVLDRLSQDNRRRPACPTSSCCSWETVEPVRESSGGRGRELRRTEGKWKKDGSDGTSNETPSANAPCVWKPHRRRRSKARKRTLRRPKFQKLTPSLSIPGKTTFVKRHRTGEFEKKYERKCTCRSDTRRIRALGNRVLTRTETRLRGTCDRTGFGQPPLAWRCVHSTFTPIEDRSGTTAGTRLDRKSLVGCAMDTTFMGTAPSSCSMSRLGLRTRMCRPGTGT